METLLTRVANGYMLRPPQTERHCSADYGSVYVFGTFDDLMEHLEKLMPLNKEAENAN